MSTEELKELCEACEIEILDEVTQNLQEENTKVLHELIYEGKPSVEDVTDPDLFELIIKYVGLEEE